MTSSFFPIKRDTNIQKYSQPPVIQETTKSSCWLARIISCSCCKTKTERPAASAVSPVPDSRRPTFQRAKAAFTLPLEPRSLLQTLQNRRPATKPIKLEFSLSVAARNSDIEDPSEDSVRHL